MSFAAIDQAIIQPPPGTRLPARFSVAQFDAMIDAGVFSAETDRQIQLLNGEIVFMTPPNPLHDDVVGLPLVRRCDAGALDGFVDTDVNPSCDSFAAGILTVLAVKFNSEIAFRHPECSLAAERCRTLNVQCCEYLSQTG